MVVIVGGFVFGVKIIFVGGGCERGYVGGMALWWTVCWHFLWFLVV